MLLTGLTDAEQVRPREPERSERVLDALATLGPCGIAPRLWVFFTDKGMDPRDRPTRLEQLVRDLDPHARARRAKVLPQLADLHDLPVAEEYVACVRALGARVVHTSRWLNGVSVQASLPTLRALAELPFVARLELVRGQRGVDPFVQPRVGPTARVRRFADPFDYGDSRGQLAESGMLAAHRLGLSGAGVIVAMLDTGFDWDQPAFRDVIASGRLLAQHDFIRDDGETHNEPGDDPSQHAHGTVTWSLVGAFVPGQVIGGAYGASFLLAKTEDVTSETPVEEDHWIAAAEWADALGADVISSSLIYTDWYQYSDMDGETAPITIAADRATTRGIVVCSAAGNYGTQDWYYIGAPADGDSVIAVGAMRADGTIADFSSHGPTYDGRIKPDVIARGDDAYCAAPEEWADDYLWLGGTSVACPLVASAAALLLEAHPSWTPAMVRSALLTTARNAATPDNDRGYGLIDVMSALHGP